MNRSYGHEIPASKAIQHMQLRLSAELVSSVARQRKSFEDTDKMIEHMRCRLKAASRQRDRNVFSP
ncbi:hypothetical protein D1BOALGB6SA_1091 [Olavius sp. associated proteobacterium Delta 1]|nr:hypothetical protein D1BOALGB6SA_1091 [Olavius sp. associated proteobacterium Delta 1]